MLCAADGDEGGRHQLITAAVGAGVLYILKVTLCLFLVVHDCLWYISLSAWTNV